MTGGGIPSNTRPLDGATPRLGVLPGATDCHMHVFAEGFASQPGGPPIVQLATAEDYGVVQRRLGLDRVIVTQPNAYQFDNRATLSALDRFGADSARAIIAVSPTQTVEELAPLTVRGVRGARIMNLPGGAVPLAGLEPVEALARELGWSLIVQFDGREIDAHLAALRAIAAPYVIDHFGKFLEPVSADDARVDALLTLIDRGNAWYKICAPYETSRSGPPGYEDVAAIARRVIAHAPERVVWGSNWPHVSVRPDAADYPDEAALLDLLLDWAPEAVRRKILVDNPAELYGF
ncbi:amidohydrolase family protein [Amorphus sp. MBR-141]